MKKALICIIVLLLVFGPAACGAAAPAEESSQNTEITAESSSDKPEESTADSSSESTAEEPAVQPSPEEPAPIDPDKVFYFANVLETNRIYRQGLDGSGLTLICDVRASGVTELGDFLYFASWNGTLCRCPSAGGPAEAVFTEYPVMCLHKVNDTSLTFICHGEDEEGYVNETYLYRHDTKSGRFEKIADGVLSDSLSDGSKVIYTLPNEETYETEYYCYDFDTDESRFCEGIQGIAVFAFENNIYGYQENEDGSTLWYRYDLGSMQSEEIDLNATSFDQVLGFDGRDLLVQNETDIYKVTDPDRSLVHSFPNGTWILPVAQKGDTVIISAAHDKTAEVFGETRYYHEWEYYAVSLASGEVTEITDEGEAGKLFDGCIFPQMDVSTARKPLAADLCDLFFRQYGKEGPEPQNHKSHGAWLNLADKGCDLILVPAPTDEEKAYLAEKNVEADMKAFGADGLVFIGGTGSGVTSLSMEQLKAIYRGEITNWKELGGADHAITVFYRNDQSGSQRQFEKLVWKDEEVPDFESMDFSIMNDMVSIVRQCQNDPYAIGYSIMTYLTDVFDNKDVVLMGIDGVVPTLETVTDNTYPLTLRDFVVIRSDEPEGSPARRLYDWFGSPQCDDLLLQNDLTPIHESGDVQN